MRVFYRILLCLLVFASCNYRSAQTVEVKGENNAVEQTAPTATTEPEKKSEKGMTDEKNITEANIKTVSLEATAEKTGTDLIIKYQVRNLSDQVIYLWDRMIGYNDQGQFIDPGSAYVFYEEPDTVRVIAGVLPLPKSRDVGRKEIPYARTFPPNSTLEGEIRLPLPVKEFSPYFEAMTEENQKEVECKQIRLLVGWTTPRKGMKITERNVGGEEVVAIRGGWEKPYHRIMEKLIPVETELLTYTSDFERQMPLQ